MRTYTYKIEADNQSAQLRLWSTVYQRWRCYKYTFKITAEKND